jgi:dUTP pyrophosphatase
VKAKHLRATTLPLPAYQTDGAAGLDLYADGVADQEVLRPGEVRAFDTNVAVEIPPGHEGQVRGRSGLAFKHGVFGYVGTIDSDYRGELKALLFNTSHEDFVVRRGDRIAQLVIAPVVRVQLEEGVLSAD